jgi:MFS family permease
MRCKGRSWSQYHPLVWVLVGGTIFSRAAMFMSLPFLTIYLAQHTEIDPALAGLTVGLGPLAGTFCGFVGGNLSDQFGRRTVMVTAMFLWAGVYIGFAIAEHIVFFMLLNLLNGVCRSFFEPTSQALMADITPPERRIRVFGFRYLAINVGAVIGPLIGAVTGILAGKTAFLITGTVYFVYAWLLLLMLNHYRHDLTSHVTQTERERVGMRAAFQVVRNDAALRFFLAGAILANIGYAQIETTLPLYLKQNVVNGELLFSILLAINAGLVVILQMLLTRWSEKRPILQSLLIGTILFAAGMGCFAVGQHEAWFVIGMVILTVGEILIFPTNSLFIDRLAPDHLRGTYFGANGFQGLGFFMGPSLGGWLVQQLGGHWGFAVIGLVVIGAMYFYWMGMRVYQFRSCGLSQETSVVSSSVSGEKLQV